MISTEEIAEIYDQFSTILFRYILRFTVDRAIAEDILHDTFVSFITQSHRYDIKTRNPGPLLFRIARNKSLDLIKRRSRENPEIAETASNLPGPEEKYISSETTRALEKCISLLPEKHRQAYNLRKDNDLTFPELSKLSGIPERTLKRRVSEAVQRIYECLKKGGYFIFYLILWPDFIFSSLYIIKGF